LQEQPEPAQLNHRQVMVVFGALMVGMLLSALDTTLLSTALPTIVGEFKAIEKLPWVITAYMLCSTATMPLYGKLSDIYGRKRLFQIAICLYLFGAILAGTSQSMTQLIICRGIQGLGAGGILTMPMAIMGDILAPRDRGRYVGYFSLVFTLANVTGPLVGGLFIDNFSWRWLFYLNLPLGLAALVITTRVLHISHNRVDRPIDFFGAGLITAGISCILLALSWGGNEYAWDSPVIIGLFAGGGVLLLLFLLQETRAEEPILPLRLFSNQVFSIGDAMVFLLGMGMLSFVPFLMLHFQIVKGESATHSGLFILPASMSVVVTTFISGRLISAHGRYKVFPIIGTAIMTVGVIALSRIGPGTSIPETILIVICLGSGVGLIQQVTMLAIQNSVSHGDLGVATASVTFFRQMGGTFGITSLGAILVSRLNDNFARLVPPDALAGLDPASLRSSPAQIQELPPDVHAAVVQSFANSIQDALFWLIPAFVLAFALSWLLKEIPLRAAQRPGVEAAESDQRGESAAPLRGRGFVRDEAEALGE
jgi:EmrB/QacA subfamily drug resistance transporter